MLSPHAKAGSKIEEGSYSGSGGENDGLECQLLKCRKGAAAVCALVPLWLKLVNT
jgi:hypothetical protein